MDSRRLAGSILRMPGEHANEREISFGLLLLNEPDENVRDALTVLLEGQGWTVRHVDGCPDFEAAEDPLGITAVISESSLPDCTPEEILDRCKQHGVPVIFTGHDLPLQGAVDLIRQGAMDFLDKPFPQARLLDLLEDLKNRQNSQLK
jgi:DNA-binding NtrC family response regulator